jgi:hypothetical protein
MFLRLAAACLIFLWTAGSAAEAEECHGNSRALSTSFPVANAEEWAATLEAPAASPACWAGGASPWLAEAVPSSLPVANAEEWAATLEAPAATSARWAGWVSPWLVEAVHTSLPLAKAAHAAASKVSTVSSPGSNATRHLGPWRIASLPLG